MTEVAAAAASKVTPEQVLGFNAPAKSTNRETACE
jgi:hypothetical protein